MLSFFNARVLWQNAKYKTVCTFPALKSSLACFKWNVKKPTLLVVVFLLPRLNFLVMSANAPVKPAVISRLCLLRQSNTVAMPGNLRALNVGHACSVVGCVQDCGPGFHILLCARFSEGISLDSRAGLHDNISDRPSAKVAPVGCH